MQDILIDNSDNKLSKELAFLKEKNAAFVFTGYEFADADIVTDPQHI